MSHGLNRRQSVRRLATLLLAACAWASAWANRHGDRNYLYRTQAESTETFGNFRRNLPGDLLKAMFDNNSTNSNAKTSALKNCCSRECHRICPT